MLLVGVIVLTNQLQLHIHVHNIKLYLVLTLILALQQLQEVLVVALRVLMVEIAVSLKSVPLEVMEEHNLQEVQQELHPLEVLVMEMLVLPSKVVAVVIMLATKLLQAVVEVAEDIMEEAEALVVMMDIQTHKLILA